MEKILFIAPVENDGTLSKISLEALTAAKQLSADLNAGLSIALWGEKTADAGNTVAAAGAEKIFSAASSDLAQARYISDAPAVESLIKASEASIIITGGQSRTARVIAGVTARLNGVIDTHVNSLQVEGANIQISRWFYRQRMEGKLSRSDRPWILSVDGGCFPAYAEPKGAATVEEVPVSLPADIAQTKVLGIKAPASDLQTIRPDAKLLFVAGAGWTKKQNNAENNVKKAESLIKDFLNKESASLGSTKALVDLNAEGHDVISFMSHLNQVGQTGATPRHPKGLATCCHGEEPHVVGWRFINQRRAVNIDSNCGWAHGKADVLYVGDAYEIMQKVNTLLS